jgi:hypothetical protein
LIVGTALAITTWYTVQLNRQVAQLHDQICTLQRTSLAIAEQLEVQGVHITLPPATACTPAP